MKITRSVKDKIKIKICDNKKCEWYNKFNVFCCDNPDFQKCKKKKFKIIEI